MELKDPRITVQNTTGGDWQITADGLLSSDHGLETVNFTVLVPRSDLSMPQLTEQGIRRAIFLLQQHLDVSQEIDR